MIKLTDQTDQDAWLDPDGHIIEVGHMQHNNYASELLENEMGFERMMDYIDKHNISSPYEILHLRGWVRIVYNCDDTLEILGNCIDLTKPMRNTIDPVMNVKQLRVAKKLCRDNGITLQDAVNCGRFIK